MIIASQKKKENIAEYLLYMWQIEDIIRAYGLDIGKIQKHIINSYDLPEEQKKSKKAAFFHGNIPRCMIQSNRIQ